MPVYDAAIIQERIDTHWKEQQEDGRRKHLGGSLIGRECMRELWYSFRWATKTLHEGRILRLFDRGHKEEFRFVEFLQQLGCEVREYSQALWWSASTDSYQLLDWEEHKGGTGDFVNVTSSEHHVKRAKQHGTKVEQWRVKDCNGHFGGSLDGITYNMPEVEIAPGVFICAEDPVMAEFKTHGEKSFIQLVKKGLKDTKPEHYSQMQVYMLKRSIKYGLYMAVNKNTDELKCFWVVADAVDGAALIGKADRVITSPMPLNRISSNPSWFKCRFCDHRRKCHMGEPMEKNCRTCQFSAPIKDGEWHCSKWNCVIPLEGQKLGCDAHHMITD